MSKSCQKVVRGKVVPRPSASASLTGRKSVGRKSTCKKCKRIDHYDPHRFANWKAPTKTCNVSRQGFNNADYAGLQVDLPPDFSDAESDTLYTTAMSAAQEQQQRN
jgi:hypothetical protein